MITSHLREWSESDRARRCSGGEKKKVGSCCRTNEFVFSLSWSWDPFDAPVEVTYRRWKEVESTTKQLKSGSEAVKLTER